MTHLLEVRNLKTVFNVEGNQVLAVDGVNYYIDEGEIVSFVGESGSGKSVTQMSGLQLIPMPPGEIVGGEVLYKGVNLLQLDEEGEEMRRIRGGEIGFIFQEPMTSLNPVLTIGEQLIETIMLHKKVSRKEARQQAIQMLNKVGIPDPEVRIDEYPHQFSGGMRQRIMIAMALSVNPKILIADEATTALDVTTQAQILEMLRDVVKETKTALIIVTHNLGIVARYAQRIYVMYAGNVVETGTTEQIFNSPKHPYTIGLLNAVPRLDHPKGEKLIPIEGTLPDLANKPPYCSFLPRCPYRTESCSGQPSPPAKKVDEGHYVACYVDVSQAQPTDQHNALKAASPSSTLAPSGDPKEVILEVEDLKVYFPVTKGILKRKVADVKAVDGVSFQLRKGETLGLVGESGCGKTTVARTIMGLYEPTGGRIYYQGEDITQMPAQKLKEVRRHLSMIFQDPYSSLNPRQTAESIVGEPLIIHKLVKDSQEYERRVDELFHMVGLDPSLKKRVPHEFSGGQRQRIGIARALACEPSVIVCDEAISALDVSIQAQIINLLEHLKETYQLTYLFIAHDLSVVRHISDRVAVMYLGRIVEIADWQSIYTNPKHPYTKALLNAVPIPDPQVEATRERILLEGEIPSPLKRPKGCSFRERCPLATDHCGQVDPHLRPVGNEHHVACLNV